MHLKTFYRYQVIPMTLDTPYPARADRQAYLANILCLMHPVLSMDYFVGI